MLTGKTVKNMHKMTVKELKKIPSRTDLPIVIEFTDGSIVIPARKGDGFIII